MRSEYGVPKHPTPCSYFLQLSATYAATQPTQSRVGVIFFLKHTITEKIIFCRRLKKNAVLLVRIRRDRAGHRDGVSLSATGPVERKPGIHARSRNSAAPPQRSPFRSCGRRNHGRRGSIWPKELVN
jgi:hypothetical protein